MWIFKSTHMPQSALILISETAQAQLLRLFLTQLYGVATEEILVVAQMSAGQQQL